jgi:hypothetical protein
MFPCVTIGNTALGAWLRLAVPSPRVSVVILVAWIGASREIDAGILFLSDKMR